MPNAQSGLFAFYVSEDTNMFRKLSFFKLMI